MSLLLLTLIGCPMAKDDTAGPETGDTADTGEAPPAMLPSDFPATLTETLGCGDIEMDAYDPDQTVRIHVVAGLHLVADACASGPQSVDVALPETAVHVVAEVGTNVSVYACTDDVDAEPVVTRDWSVTAGTVTFDVTAIDSEDCEGSPLADATVTLTDVLFEPYDGGDGAVTVSSATFTSRVGWIPG